MHDRRDHRDAGIDEDELAGGDAGLALASGMAAIHGACAAVLRAGDRVVAPTAAYGSTRVQLGQYFGRFGVKVDLVDITDLDAVAAALAAAPTRLLYAESSANPTTFVADHAALAELAHRAGATYIADNTFASSHVCRPLALGADLVVERDPAEPLLAPADGPAHAELEREQQRLEQTPVGAEDQPATQPDDPHAGVGGGSASRSRRIADTFGNPARASFSPTPLPIDPPMNAKSITDSWQASPSISA